MGPLIESGSFGLGLFHQGRWIARWFGLETGA